MINIKQYLPIRIFHTYYSYGWWWGSKFYFFKRGFFRVCMAKNCHEAEYASNGHIIGHGEIDSWSPKRQQESREPRNN